MIINMTPQRRVRDNIISSGAMPAIHIKVDPPLKHLTTLKFIVMETQHVELYLFGDRDDSGHVKRLLTVQFEGYLPDNDFRFEYEINQKVRLGGFDYLHDTGVLKVDAALKRRPESDLAAWVAWLRQHGSGERHDSWNEFIYSRYVRLLDLGRRNELLILYFENLKDLGFSVDELVSGGARAGELSHLSTEVSKRALDSFSIIKG